MRGRAVERERESRGALSCLLKHSRLAVVEGMPKSMRAAHRRFVRSFRAQVKILPSPQNKSAFELLLQTKV